MPFFLIWLLYCCSSKLKGDFLYLTSDRRFLELAVPAQSKLISFKRPTDLTKLILPETAGFRLFQLSKAFSKTSNLTLNMFEIVLIIMADHSVLLAADFVCSWYSFSLGVLHREGSNFRLNDCGDKFFPRKPLGWYVSLKSNQTDTWTENLKNLTLGRTACLQERKFVTK